MKKFLFTLAFVCLAAIDCQAKSATQECFEANTGSVRKTLCATVMASFEVVGATIGAVGFTTMSAGAAVGAVGDLPVYAVTQPVLLPMEYNAYQNEKRRNPYGAERFSDYVISPWNY